MKFLYENGPSGVYHKAQNAVANNRLARRKEARKFLTKIMPTEEEKKKQREREFDREIKISVLVPLFRLTGIGNSVWRTRRMQMRETSPGL